MATRIDVKIDGHDTIDGHVEYFLYTTEGGKLFRAQRRYREFPLLVEAISKAGFPTGQAASVLPGRRLTSGPAVIEERTVGLQQFLAALLALFANSPLPPLLRIFLGYPSALDLDGILWNPNADLANGMITKPPGSNATTCAALMKDALSKHAELPCAGRRPLIRRHYEEVNGKSVEKLEYSNEYTWLTYREYGARIEVLGKGLVAFASMKKDDRVCIYAETQLEWMLACQAAFSQSLQVVTVYATLGEEGLVHGVSQTKSKVVIADAKLLKVLASAVANSPAKMRGIKVVYIPDPVRDRDPPAEEAFNSAKAALDAAGVPLIALAGVEQMGIGAEVAAPPELVAEDVAIIMYTSGTTGMPKGVLITHGNVAALVGGMAVYFRDAGVGSPEDSYLAYLPLAHIMELAAEITFLTLGTRLGYGSPHTLTSTGVKIKAGRCEGDAPTLKPTILVFAPAVLDKVYNGIHAKMSAQSSVVQTLFARGLAAGDANFDANYVGAGMMYNSIIFKKVQGMVGGNLKLALTGSAPLAPGVQKFVQTAFNCPVRQGYGLTETCAGSCIQPFSESRTGAVGVPTQSACVKLVDWPEGNYLTSDAEKADIGMPRGEILIGGPAVCKGYLVDDTNPDAEVVKKNHEEFSVDSAGRRWFHTGDVGQITKSGTLQIIDRKKDLVKLQQGEYVALSKVENVLKLAEAVELPMCFARSTESFCVALVCPSHAVLRRLATDLGLPGDTATIEDLCSAVQVVKAVEKQCKEACKGKLVAFEIPKKIGLVAEAWTPENDLLTAAMKLKRVPIVKKHEQQLNELYEQ